jgi:hypothetical protein
MRSEKVTRQSNDYRHILHARWQLIVAVAKEDVKQEATSYRKKLATVSQEGQTIRSDNYGKR